MKLGDEVMAALNGSHVRADHPGPLVAIVSELATLLGIATPSVWLLPMAEMNAAAAGESPYTAAVGVTTGLLRRLSPSELRAVLAHELGHIQCGHVADRTIHALACAGETAYLVGNAAGIASTIAAVVAHAHPLLRASIAATGLGAHQYGTAKYNQAFARMRQTEWEADNFAHQLGYSVPLASALVRSQRADCAGVGFPDWSKSLLFARLNSETHPPTPDRVRAAIQAVSTARGVSPPEACDRCGAPLHGRHACPNEFNDPKPPPCTCGNTPSPPDRFCGTCGRPLDQITCRFCGRRDTDRLPNCSACGFPLP